MSTAFAVNHAPGLSGNATFYKITGLKSWAGKGLYGDPLAALEGPDELKSQLRMLFLARESRTSCAIRSPVWAVFG